MESGLYARLSGNGRLVSHEASTIEPSTPDGYCVIEPERIPFISYPYEWSFGQLKQAALLTLDIFREAIEFGFSLKDASAYNIQFVGARPVMIDTLSFERLDETKPWVAYSQFCQHFLAPLALMAYTDVRLAQLLRVYIDGLPLDLASQLLPVRTKLFFGLLTHIHLHAKSQKKHAGKKVAQAKGSMSRRSLLGLIDSLDTCCRSMKWKLPATTWGDYYDDTNYSDRATSHKAELIRSYALEVNPGIAWDLGANDGRFSRLLSEAGAYTIAFDIDPVAVEKNFQRVSLDNTNNLLPLLLDLTNPSAGVGWANEERLSLAKRGPADLVMALALAHHLAIGNNISLTMIARYLASVTEWLIIEFVPKEDSQIKRLLVAREDIFVGYNLDQFECDFSSYFVIKHKEPISDSIRTLYLMKRI